MAGLGAAPALAVAVLACLVAPAGAAEWQTLGNLPMEPGAIAGDANGNLTLLGGTDDRRVLKATSRPHNGTWSVLDTIIEQEFAQFSNPVVKVNSSSEAAASWMSGGLQYIYGSIREASGHWRTPTLLREGPSLFNDIFIDEEGAATAFWTYYPPGSQVLASSRRNRGGSWMDLGDVSDVNLFPAFNIETFGGPDGRVAAVWQGRHQQGIAEYAIWFREFLPGSGWGEPEKISVPVPAAVSMTGTMDGEGRVVLAWVLEGDGDKTVWVVTRGADGAWSTPEPLWIGQEPWLNIDAQGQVTLIWQDPDGPNSAILARTRSVAGSWSQTVELAYADGDDDEAVSPRVVGSAADGSTIAVWDRISPSAQTFEAAKLTEDGSWTALGGFEYSQATGAQTGPMEMDPNGNVLATWKPAGDLSTSVAVLDAVAPQLSDLVFPTQAVVGEEVEFSASAADTWSEATVEWRFGGEPAVESDAVTRQWSSPDDVTVEVTATDEAGNSTTVSRTVSITEPGDPGGGDPAGGGPKGGGDPSGGGLGGGDPSRGGGPSGGGATCQPPAALAKQVKSLKAKIARNNAKIKRLNRQIRSAKSPARKRSLKAAQKKARKTLKNQRLALRTTETKLKRSCL